MEKPPKAIKLGVAYAYKGNNSEAIEAYLQALEKNPNHVPAIGNLANRYRDQGKLVEAIRMYQRYLDLRPISEVAYHNLGHTYRLLGLYEQAKYSYHTAIKLNPEYQFAYGNLALNYLYQGDTERATEYLDKLMQVDSNRLGSLVGAATLALVYDPERAQDYVERIISVPNYDPRVDVSVPVIQGYLLMARNDSTQAKAVLSEQRAIMEEAIAEGNENAGARLRVAEIYGLLGDQDNCILWLEKAEEAGYLNYKWLELYPLYNNVREDPRFQAILQRMKDKVVPMREQVLAMELKG